MNKQEQSHSSWKYFQQGIQKDDWDAFKYQDIEQQKQRLARFRLNQIKDKLQKSQSYEGQDKILITDKEHQLNKWIKIQEKIKQIQEENIKDKEFERQQQEENQTDRVVQNKQKVQQEEDPLDIYFKENLKKESDLNDQQQQEQEQIQQDNISLDEQEISTFINEEKNKENRKQIKNINLNIYRPSQELKYLTQDQIKTLRYWLNQILVKGNTDISPIFSWYHCGFPQKFCSVLQEQKLLEPFPIQCQTIPILLSGKDCLVIAETGSGKTLAYMLPLIQQVVHYKSLNPSIKYPLAVVIVPTWELAFQILSVSQAFIQSSKLKSAALVGGVNYQEQFWQLKQNPDIVVCTPGRLIEIISSHKSAKIQLDRVIFLALDESDWMFDMGFGPQLQKIINQLPQERLSCLVSATFPKNIEKLSDQVLNNPVEIIVGQKGQISRNVQIELIKCTNQDKIKYLLKYLGIYQDQGNIIVFLDKLTQAELVYQELNKYKYKPLLIHGKMDQEDWTENFIKINQEQNNILISTSLMSWGLDLKSVVLVINYDCPTYKEDFVHWVGWTGRGTNKGLGVTLITDEDKEFAAEIIQVLKISSLEVPQWLQGMYHEFKELVNKGEANEIWNRNQKGKGFQFDINEAEQKNILQMIQSKDYGVELDFDEEQKIEEFKEKQLTQKKTKERLHFLKNPIYQEEIKKVALESALDAQRWNLSQEQIIQFVRQKIRDHFESKFQQKNQLKSDRVLSIKENKDNGKYYSEIILQKYPQVIQEQIKTQSFIEEMQQSFDIIISLRGVENLQADQKNSSLNGQYLYLEADNKFSLIEFQQELEKIVQEC